MRDFREIRKIALQFKEANEQSSGGDSFGITDAVENAVDSMLAEHGYDRDDLF